MNANRAFTLGISSADVNVTCEPRSPYFECWVANDLRPDGRQRLTAGDPGYCATWKNELIRLEAKHCKTPS